MSSIFLPLLDNGQGSVRANFIMSILRGFNGIDIHIERFSDSLPSRARNRAAAYFLRDTVRDYLLFIDTDIIFDKHHIDMLMESDEPILAGIYCKKSKGIEPCLNTLPGHQETQCGGYQEIARAGSGYLRIHRDVLEKMKGPKEATDLENFLNDYAAYYVNHGADEWDFFSVGVRNKEYLSEDWYFCDRSRDRFIMRAEQLGYAVLKSMIVKTDLGYKVILDTRIQLRHEGTAIYPIEETIQKHMDETNGRTAVEQVTSPTLENAS